MHKHTAKELVHFFAITFLLTWLFWGFAILKNTLSITWIPGNAFFIAGGFMPSFVAVLLVARYSGKSGVKKLTAKIADTRFAIRWYLYIFFLLPGILAASYFIAHNLYGLPFDSVLLPLIFPKIWPILLVIPYMIIAGGPLGEEIGWRGFALERLLKITGPVNASLLLGLIWTAWHLPLFFLKGTTHYQLAAVYGTGSALFGFTLSTLMLTLLMTVLFMKTKGSIFAAILFHTVVNFSHGLISIITYFSGAIAILLLMLIVTIWFTTLITRENSRIFVQLGK